MLLVIILTWSQEINLLILGNSCLPMSKKRAWFYTFVFTPYILYQPKRPWYIFTPKAVIMSLKRIKVVFMEAGASLIAQLVKNLPAMQETPVWFLGREDPLEKGQATHSRILGLLLWLSWQRICLQCRRPGFDLWVGKIPWRRERLPTPGFWPGEFHGLCSPLVRKESVMTEQLSLMEPWNRGIVSVF